MLSPYRGALHVRRRGAGGVRGEAKLISKTGDIMRLCRFNEGRLGIVEGSNVRDVTAALDVLPVYHYPLPSFDVLIANLDKVAARAKALAGAAPSIAVTNVKLLSPVANP